LQVSRLKGFAVYLVDILFRSTLISSHNTFRV
jgi:hypothetical protein